MKRLSGASPRFFLLVGKWWGRSFWKRKKNLTPPLLLPLILTPKFDARTGRWSKNDPQIRVSDRSVMQEWAQIWVSDRSMMQEWPPNLTSELPGGRKWPLNSMLGVVGRVKRPPKFDARGDRKGKMTPQIWCSGWSEGENDPPNLMLGVVGRVKGLPDLNWWLNADSKIDLFINEFSFGSSFEGGNLFDDLDLLRRIGVR